MDGTAEALHARGGAAMPAPLLRMAGVRKAFGATQALADATFAVDRGTVHALVGENGAGKSTLVKILAGVHAPDAGVMEIEGRRFAPRGPADARAAGIAMIHQELSIAPHLTVAGNILLGRERRRAGFLRPFLDRAANRAVARAALERLRHGDLDLGALAGALPIALQQVVEIARALAADARVIVFDEPTSSLARADAERLFAVIRELSTQGLGVVYISHFLEEVERVSDAFTVLRDGAVVAHGAMAGARLSDIVRAMVGREVGELFPRVERTPGAPVLDLSGLTGARFPRGVDLTLHRGEILGLFGLVGAGRSELLRCVFGLDPVRAGTVRVAGVAAMPRQPARSIAQGLGLLSEDRKAEGLAVDLSIADNLTLTRLRPYVRGGLLDLRARRAAAARWIQHVGCKARRPDQRVAELSGGNQQKIAIARLLHQQADVLLLDEPTRGIDVAAKADVYRLMHEQAAAGRAIVMVSSYLPELLNVCDRVGVMCRGELRGVRPARAWTEEAIMQLATGTGEAA